MRREAPCVLCAVQSAGGTVLCPKEGGLDLWKFLVKKVNYLLFSFFIIISSVNPVTGCYEPPKPDPTAGMTEEQKEYEAMQLVNMMDRLTR